MGGGEESCVLVAEAGPRGEALGDHRARLAVRALVPLADVVQQRGDPQIARILEFAGRFRDAGIVAVFQQPHRLADGAPAVHVDGMGVEGGDVRLVAQHLPLGEQALQPLAGRQRIERPAGARLVKRRQQPLEVAAAVLGVRVVRVPAVPVRGAPPGQPAAPAPAARGGRGAQRLRGGGVYRAHRRADAAAPLRAVDAEALGHLVDEVAPQPIVGAVLDRVQRVARRQQQLARVREVGCEFGRVTVLGDRLGGGEPDRGLQRAQSAAAGLQVGLLQLPWFARPPRLVDLGEFLSHPVAAAAHGLAPAAAEALEQRLVAGNEARVEQRGEGLHVFAGGGPDLAQRAHGVADLQPAIPERVEHRVRDRPLRLAIAEQHQVHIGVAALLAAAGAAQRDDGHARGRQRLGEGAQALVQRVAQLVAKRQPGCARGTSKGAPGQRRARLQEWLHGRNLNHSVVSPRMGGAGVP